MGRRTSINMSCQFRRVSKQIMRRRLILTVALIVIAVIALGIGVMSIQAPADDNPDDQAGMLMTLDPELFVVQTQMAEATPLSDEEAQPYLDLQADVDACEDYSDERREQMLQHIDWLIDPSDIPPDAMLAMGTDIHGSLVFGMASFTQIEWRLAERPAESCLVDIGRELNDLLIAFGREPLTIYDE